MTSRIKTHGFALRLILFVALILISSSFVKAQEESATRLHHYACEEIAAVTEILGVFSRRDNERIFVISKLGKDEKNKLSDSRLRKIFHKFTIELGLKPENIIIASGTRNETKEGEIDLYLGSQLFLVLLPKVGENICLTSGGIDPEELKKMKPSN